MAASELEIEPDLNKAPPHVEGELLKQNVKSMLGKKGWTKFYFIVLRDKLQFFRKREDYKQNKEPVAFVRMSQVTEITEVVFNGVPKKHHLNCGFSIVSFHPITQQQQTFNLLTETPEDMRYWVHALRYIKAYWAKMEVRETVLSEEQERLILERILSEEEEEERDVIVGEYSLNEDGEVTGSTEPDSIKYIPVVVHFADGSKVTVKLPSTATASDLLENVKDKLTSSAAQLWLVDVNGDDVSLDPKDQLALHLSKKNKFYALDPSYRVLVIFYNTREFDSIAVPSIITANEVIEHRYITVQLDLKGVANRGLFLKSKDEEHIFSTAECPCEVLFSVDASGKITRQPVGRLVIKNKALGGGRATTRLRFKTVHKSTSRGRADQDRILEEQEEEAQSKALDLLIQKKNVVPKSQDTVHELEESWINITESAPPAPVVARPKQRGSAPSCDSRGFEEAIDFSVNRGRPNRTGSVPASASLSSLPMRPRSAAVHNEGSPASQRKRMSTSGSPAEVDKLQKSPRTSPSQSPTLTSPNRRSRSRSPRRLPGIPDDREAPKTGSYSPLMRKNATRTNKRSSISSGSDTSRRGGSLIESRGKGPTIVLSGEHKKHSSGPPEKKPSSPPGPGRARNHASLVKKKTGQGSAIVESLKANSSRSSAFGVTSPVPTSLTPEMIFQSKSPAKPAENDDERFEKLFSRSFQLEQDELSAKNYTAVDTLTSKYEAISSREGRTGGEGEGDRTETREPKVPETETSQPRPMVIDFSRLVKTTPPSVADVGSPVAAKPLAPIEIHSSSLLKVILLQASATTSGSVESRPVDFISLSGVCLRNERGKWRLQEGCNFHDPLPPDCEDHTESFPLAGGIRVIYNHTHKRWHVLPPPTPSPSVDESLDSTERSQSFDEKDGSESSELQLSLLSQKKTVVTEIGTAAQQILSQFERTRDSEEKKKIGSDMTNPAMGAMIRGRFCSAIASLLCDGMKPARLGGLVQDDIWKVTVAFCHEAQRNHTSPLVFLAFDKLILQPISSLKTLKDNNIKFRTFVCLAMSKGMLVNLLEALPKQKDTLRKYYLPSSLLAQSSEGGVYCKLYKQLLQDVEPIAYLPFHLSIDFEIKQALAPQGIQQNGTVEQQPQPKKPPLRTSVIIKTHAATGQKTGNVISAVWQTPVEAKAVPSVREEPDASGQPSGIQALKTIQQQHLAPTAPATSLSPSPSPVRSLSPMRSPSPMHSPSRSPAPPTAKDSWFKRIATSLNAGGAITGAPKTSQPQVRVPPAQPPAQPPLRKVRALYKNMAEDADELSFNKDDIMIVKEQINEEWLICIHGNESGIVPINYVQEFP